MYETRLNISIGNFLKFEYFHIWKRILNRKMMPNEKKSLARENSKRRETEMAML